MPSRIRFILKPGASWDIDTVLADIQVIVPYLNLTSHNYYETSRQSLLIRAEMAKKKGREFSPVFLSNNLIDLKEKEEITGVCKAFTIELGKTNVQLEQLTKDAD